MFKSVITALRSIVKYPHLGLLNSGIFQHFKPCTNGFELHLELFVLKGH